MQPKKVIYSLMLSYSFFFKEIKGMEKTFWTGNLRETL